MARVLGLWFWIIASALTALVVTSAFDVIEQCAAILFGSEGADSFDLAPRWIALLVAGLLIAPLFPPVRKRLWRRGWLGDLLRNRVFEDLDGEWTVRIESNWPTVERLLKASSDPDADRFDPVANPDTIPELRVIEFDASIAIGWEKAEATFHPNNATPLRQSRTITFELLRKCADNPARVFWGFRQFNTSVEATDEDNFLGAAMLDVVSADELDGVYWNNRAWRRGLNVAGRIIMRRKE